VNNRAETEHMESAPSQRQNRPELLLRLWIPHPEQRVARVDI